MAKNTRFVGLDVHAETIAVAVAEGRGKVRALGTIPNRPEAVRRLLGKVGKPGELRVCYEAGPTGYALYWQLTAMGIACEVIAPSLAPSKPGDRVKTDRRDAERLASSYQAGTLTVVWVPDPKHEALRDLVRAREAAKQDTKRAKHRLGKYLLRYGQRPPSVSRAWTAGWWQWVRKLELPHGEQNTTLLELILEVDHQSQRVARHDGAIDRAVASAPEHLRAIVTALQALRGVAQETAVTVALEFGSFSRFERAPQAMGYTEGGRCRFERLAAVSFNSLLASCLRGAPDSHVASPMLKHHGSQFRVRFSVGGPDKRKCGADGEFTLVENLKVAELVFGEPRDGIVLTWKAVQRTASRQHVGGAICPTTESCPDEIGQAAIHDPPLEFDHAWMERLAISLVRD